MTQGTPSWKEAIYHIVQKAILEMHTAMPGVVQSYDAAQQTAVVKPLIKWQRFLPGRQLKDVFDLPPLQDVLVCHPRAGAKGLHLPLQSGDLVLLIFCDRNIASWRSQSKATNVSDPGTYEPQPMSGAVALPLMNHDSIPWDTALANSSLIHIGDEGGSFDFVAWASEVDDRLSTIQSTFDSHEHETSATIGTGGPKGKISPPTSTIGSLASVANEHVKVS